LTNVSSTITCGLLCCALAAGGRAGTAALTSNDILQLAGRGDTIWLATTKGLNYTLDTGDSLTDWWAWENAGAPWSLAFDDRAAFAVTDAQVEGSSASFSFAVYHHDSDTLLPYSLRWNYEHYRARADTTETQVLFVAYDAVRAGSAWWLACVDGGLVRWRPGEAARAAVPGIDDSLVDIARKPPEAFLGVFGKPWARPVAVDVAWAQSDTAAIWVATPGRIWRFDPAGTSWDSLSNRFANGELEAAEFLDVHVNRGAVPPRVYATVAVKRPRGDTATYLCKYENDVWEYVYGSRTGQKPPRGVAFAFDRYVYVVDSTRMYLVLDSAEGPATVPRDAEYFNRRLLASSENVPWEILRLNDILVTAQTDSTVRLWLATTHGLFSAHDEMPGRESSDPFVHTRRTLSLGGGVDHVRAYPTLFTPSAPNHRVNFAYRLTKPDAVTIRVYDWNMDLVRTIISNARREAAPEGKTSNEENRDYWDGRNEAGRVVAPGVYYYEISSDKGGRSFGKIVVALPR
jgi:hypothetical protein